MIAHGSFQQKLSIENQPVNVAFWSGDAGPEEAAAASATANISNDQRCGYRTRKLTLVYQRLECRTAGEAGDPKEL
ncbi:MAG: hypothetical protein J0G94_15275 [Sphingomonadales bacterium]|nr:hypothetical protein [Sphingomonadales bacterium]